MALKSMKRKELQALCKKHGLPANSTNSQMIEGLSAILQVEEKAKPRGCLKGYGGSSGEDLGVSRGGSKKVTFVIEDDEDEDIEEIERKPGRKSKRKSVGRRSSVVPKIGEESEEADEDSANDASKLSRRTTRSRGLAEAVLWSPVIEKKKKKVLTDCMRGARSNAGPSSKTETNIPTARFLRNRVVVVGGDEEPAVDQNPRRTNKRKSSEVVEENEKMVALLEKKNLRKRVRGRAPVEDEPPLRSSGRNQRKVEETTVTEVVDAGRPKKCRKGDKGVTFVEKKAVEEIENPAVPLNRTRGNSTALVLDTVAAPEPTRRSTRSSSTSLEDRTTLTFSRKSVEGEEVAKSKQQKKGKGSVHDEATVTASDSEALADPRRTTRRSNAVQVVAEPTRRSTRSYSVSPEDDTSTAVVGESGKQEGAGRKSKAKKQAKIHGRKGAEATALLPDNEVAVDPRRRLTHSSSTSLEDETSSPVLLKSVKEDRVIKKRKLQKPARGRTTLIPVTEAVVEGSSKRSTRSSTNSPVDEDATTVEEKSRRAPKSGDSRHEELAASLLNNQAVTESTRRTTRSGSKLLEDEVSFSADGQLSSHHIGTNVKIKAGKHVTSSALKHEALSVSAPDSEALTSPTKSTTCSSSKLDDAPAQTVGKLGSDSDTIRKEKAATEGKNHASNSQSPTAILVKTKDSTTKQTRKSSSSAPEEGDLVAPLLSDIEAATTPSRRSTRSSAQLKHVSFTPVVSFGGDTILVREKKLGKRASSQVSEGADSMGLVFDNEAAITTSSRRSTRSSAQQEDVFSPPVVSIGGDTISARENKSGKRVASQASEVAHSMALVSDNEAAITTARRSTRSFLNSLRDSHTSTLGGLPAVLSGNKSETTPGRRSKCGYSDLSEDVSSTPVVGKSNADNDTAWKVKSKETENRASAVADLAVPLLNEKAVMTPATRSTRSSLKSFEYKASKLVDDDGTARKDISGKVAGLTASSLDDKAVLTPATRSTRISLKSLGDNASKLVNDDVADRKGKSGKQSKIRASKHGGSTTSACRPAVTESRRRSTRSSSMQNLLEDDTPAVVHVELGDHDVEVQEHVSEKQGQFGSGEEVHGESMLEMEASGATEGMTNICEVQQVNVSPSPPTIATSISPQINHEEPSAEGEIHRAGEDGLAGSESVTFVFSPLIHKSSEEPPLVGATEVSPQFVTDNTELIVEGDGPAEDVLAVNEGIRTSDPVVSGTIVFSETSSDIRVEVTDSQVEVQYVSKVVEYSETKNPDSKVEIDEGLREDAMAGDEPVRTSDPMTSNAAAFAEAASDINLGEPESKVEVQDVNEGSMRGATNNDGSPLPEVPEASCFIKTKKSDSEMEVQDASEGRMENSEATNDDGLPSPDKFSGELSPAATILEDSNLQVGIRDSAVIPIGTMDINDKDVAVPILLGSDAVKMEGCEEESDAVSDALLDSVECNTLKETEETLADNTTLLGPGETKGAYKSLTLPVTVDDGMETEGDRNEDGTSSSVSDMQTGDDMQAGVGVKENELHVSEGSCKDAADVRGSEEDDAVESGRHEREAERPFSLSERPAVALQEEGSQLSLKMTLDSATPASHDNANQSDSTQMPEGEEGSPEDAEVNTSVFSGDKSLEVVKDLSDSPRSLNSLPVAHKANEHSSPEPVGISYEITERKSSVYFDSDSQSPDSSKPIKLMMSEDIPEAVDVESSSLADDGGGNTGASHPESDKSAVEEGAALHPSLSHAEEILPEGGSESPATLGLEDSTKQEDNIQETENTGYLLEEHRDTITTGSLDGNSVQKSPVSAPETDDAMGQPNVVADDLPETSDTADEPTPIERERDTEQIDVIGEDMESVDPLEGEMDPENELKDTSMERAGHISPAAEPLLSTYTGNAQSVNKEDEYATSSEEEENLVGEEFQPANILSSAKMLEETSAATAKETAYGECFGSPEPPDNDLTDLSHKSVGELNDDNEVGNIVESEVRNSVYGDLKEQVDSPTQSEKADKEGKKETSFLKTESLETAVLEKHVLDSAPGRSIDLLSAVTFECKEVEKDETSTSGGMDISNKHEEGCSISVVACTEIVDAEHGVDHSTSVSVEKIEKFVFIGGYENNEASIVTDQPPLGRQELIGSSSKESSETLVTDPAEDDIGVSFRQIDQGTREGSPERVLINRAEDMGVSFCEYDQENSEDDTGCRDLSEALRNSRNAEEAAENQDNDGIDIAQGSGSSSEDRTQYREPNQYQDNRSYKQASNVEGSWIQSSTLSVDELFHMDNDMADFMDNDAQAGQWGCNLREDFGPGGCGNYGEVHGAETLPSGNHMEPMAANFNMEREQACSPFGLFDNYLRIAYPGSHSSPRGQSLYHEADHIDKHGVKLSREQFVAQEQSRIISQEAPEVSGSVQHEMVSALDGTKIGGSTSKRVGLQADSAIAMVSSSREQGVDQGSSLGFVYRQGSAIKRRHLSNELVDPESNEYIIGSQNATDTQRGKTSEDETLADKIYFDAFWSDPENVDVSGSHHEVQDMDYPFDLTLAQKDAADDSLKSDADVNKEHNMSSELGMDTEDKECV